MFRFLFVTISISVLITVCHCQETTMNPSDADVCNDSKNSKFFGNEWCKSLSPTEGCRVGIVNLLFAAANGDKDSLIKYNASGMDMSLVDYDGRAALHLAAAEGFLNCVEFLLTTAKVPSKPKDRWGNLPIDEAQRFGHKHVVDYLTKYYANEGTQ